MGKRGTLSRDRSTRCWIVVTQKDEWIKRRSLEIVKISRSAHETMKKATENSLHGITEDDLRWMRKKKEQAARRKNLLRRVLNG